MRMRRNKSRREGYHNRKGKAQPCFPFFYACPFAQRHNLYTPSNYIGGGVLRQKGSTTSLFASTLSLFASCTSLGGSTASLFASTASLFTSSLSLFASRVRLFASTLNLFASRTKLLSWRSRKKLKGSWHRPAFSHSISVTGVARGWPGIRYHKPLLPFSVNSIAIPVNLY